MEAHKSYLGFISYSHTDRATAKWLHKALEAYKVPRKLIGKTVDGEKIPARLHPIFLDREELPTAGDLSQTVQNALQNSKFLIVICSPHAVSSQWVNREIIEFKRLHGEKNILCLIVDGEPFAARKGDAQAECFPEAVRFHVGADGAISKDEAEPIAADLRPQGDGKRLAFLKVASGLLGVGLDELVQRDQKRRQRRLTIITTASLIGMVAMGTLTLIAVEARKVSEERKAQAESLVEFMLTDLRKRLEPVGRLDALDAVAIEALNYYAETDPKKLDVSSLGRQARALHLLGEIHELKGELDQAHKVFLTAYGTTGELLERFPDDEQRLYEHAQSAFWVGYIEWRRAHFAEAQTAFEDYLALAMRLTQIAPDNTDWQMELAYAYVNLGALIADQGQTRQTLEVYGKALAIFDSLVEQSPDTADYLLNAAQARAWISGAHEKLGEIATARDYRMTEVDIYLRLLQADPNNTMISEYLLAANRALGRLALYYGDLDGAESTLRSALTRAERLSRLDPENKFWAQMKGLIQNGLAEVLIARRQFEEAESLTLAAKAIADQLLSEDPTVVEWRVDLWSFNGLLRTEIAHRRGDFEGGLLIHEDVLRQLETVLGETPDHRLARNLRTQSIYQKARLLTATARGEEAQAHWQRVIDDITPLGLEISPDLIFYLFASHKALGHTNEAANLAAQLTQMEYRHPDFIEIAP
ncbi:MAG: TIR domain-containing protein [Alphaproteobacteria bacterium]|nr:MAG: TIR domain-containing protein [Alphaproteobacteria bacterium]